MTGNQSKTQFFGLFIHGLFTNRTLDQEKLVQQKVNSFEKDQAEVTFVINSNDT